MLLMSLLLLLLSSVCITTVRAFSPTIPTTTSIDVAGCHKYSSERNLYNRRQHQRRQFLDKQEYQSSSQRRQQRQVLLFLSNSNNSNNNNNDDDDDDDDDDDNTNNLIPPPLSPLSINDGNYEYDDFTPAEVTEMRDLIVSLSDETDDTNRRQRLQKTIEEALLHDPNSNANANANANDTQPKRFTVLFSRVLTQIGEQVQHDAREKYSKENPTEADKADNNDDDENNNKMTSSDATKEEKKKEEEDEDETVERIVREKTPEELKLWALVDMMVQSKTVFKKYNF
jgi:hypothetical protein